MGVKADHMNVSATMPKEFGAALERQAAMKGLSLSRYVAEILEKYALEFQMPEPPKMRVRTIDDRGRIKLTKEVINALGIDATTPLTIVPHGRGALIRPVR